MHSETRTRISVLQRGQGGDASELASIYGPLVFRMARKRGLDDNDAEDVMQQTLFEILRLLPDFEYDRAKGSFRGLLKAIVHNKSADLLRRRGREVTAALPEEIEAPAAELDAEFERQWVGAHLESAIDRVRSEVKDSTFRAFELRYLHDQAIACVAAALDQTPNRVSQNCRRVIQRLDFHLKVLMNEDL